MSNNSHFEVGQRIVVDGHDSGFIVSITGHELSIWNDEGPIGRGQIISSKLHRIGITPVANSVQLQSETSPGKHYKLRVYLYNPPSCTCTGFLFTHSCKHVKKFLNNKNEYGPI